MAEDGLSEEVILILECGHLMLIVRSTNDGNLLGHLVSSYA